MFNALLATMLLSLGQADSSLVLRNRPPITEAVFHPDGQRLFCLTHAGVEAYDTATGKLLFTAPGGHYLVCSPKGDKLALVSREIGMISVNGTIVVIDGETGKKIHQQPGTFASFSPDGRWMISHSGYSVGHPKTDLPPTMHITDLRTGKMVPAQIKSRTDMKALYFGEHSAPTIFQFTKDGKALVGRTRNERGQLATLSACELETGKALDSIPNDNDLHPLHTPNTGSDGKRYVDAWTVYDAVNGKTIAKLDTSKYSAESWQIRFQISADGKNVFGTSGKRWNEPADKDGRATITRVSALHVWDAETGKWNGVVAESKNVFTLSSSMKKKVGSLYRQDPKFVVNRQGTIAIDHAADGTMTVWDIKTGKALRKLRETGHSARPELLTFSPDSSLLASASTDGEVMLWNAKTGQPIRTLDRAAALGDIRFRPRSKELIGVGHDSIYFWNIDSGELTRTIERKGNMYRLECHPDGKRIAIADHWSDTVALLEIDTGKLLHSFVGKGKSFAFHPNGDSLLTLDTNGAIGHWDINTGKRVQYLNGGKSGSYNYRPHQIAFLADGKQFLLRENDSIAIVDLANGKRIVEHRLNTESRHDWQSMSLHPDGKRIAIGHYGEQNVEERDLQSAKVIRLHPGHAYVTAQVRYSPDGTRLASTGGYDYVIRLHRVSASEK